MIRFSWCQGYQLKLLCVHHIQLSLGFRKLAILYKNHVLFMIHLFLCVNFGVWHALFNQLCHTGFRMTWMGVNYYRKFDFWANYSERSGWRRSHVNEMSSKFCGQSRSIIQCPCMKHCLVVTSKTSSLISVYAVNLASDAKSWIRCEIRVGEFSSHWRFKLNSQSRWLLLEWLFRPWNFY